MGRSGSSGRAHPRAISTAPTSMCSPGSSPTRSPAETWCSATAPRRGPPDSARRHQRSAADHDRVRPNHDPRGAAQSVGPPRAARSARRPKPRAARDRHRPRLCPGPARRSGSRTARRRHTGGHHAERRGPRRRGRPGPPGQSGGPPVVRFVDSVILEAIVAASDIHIQPGRPHARAVSHRRVLHTAHVPPAAATAPIVSRVKVMGRMDIAERRIPQDGRASVTIGRAGIEPETPDGPSCGRAIDLRLSSLPTSHGERIVLRLLDARRTRDLGSFASLGMPAPVQRRFLTCASRSSGMILVTGPTGSGKTTTLYATLHRIAAAMPRAWASAPPDLGRRSQRHDHRGSHRVRALERRNRRQPGPGEHEERGYLRQRSTPYSQAGPRRRHGRGDPG